MRKLVAGAAIVISVATLSGCRVVPAGWNFGGTGVAVGWEPTQLEPGRWEIRSNGPQCSWTEFDDGVPVDGGVVPKGEVAVVWLADEPGLSFGQRFCNAEWRWTAPVHGVN